MTKYVAADLSRSVEDYLKVIYQLTEGGIPASTTAIADALDLSAPSVSGMVKRLAEAGLVEHQPYRGVSLTKDGRHGALRMLRRHRVIETYLVSNLGYTWDNVHDVAERLEHAVSEDLVQRMSFKLGDPQFDPHGDPIPAADGRIVDVTTTPLPEIAAGESVTISRVDTGVADRLRWLAGAGLVPGVMITVLDHQPFNGPVTVALNGERRVVGRELAAHLLCAGSTLTSTTAPGGWRHDRKRPSLPESFRTISVPRGGPWWRKALAFAGPGYMVAVGYMDPGNWATDLAGGARFGYTLLSVVLLSNLMAMLLQALALKLGIVTGRDLAQACRDHYSRPMSFALWIFCEIAIAACDLAEVIGSAIALNLLFGIPLIWGVIATALDVLLILVLQQKGFRRLEAFIVALIITIGICFAAEIAFSHPAFHAIVAGLVPTSQIVRNPDMLYIAIGILGATVMPHNLYLHSAIVQTRDIGEDTASKKEAIRHGTIDSTVALFLAFLINGAILVLASATFHGTGHESVADIGDAYKLLSPLLGTSLASVLFAVALLASGQNSTVTGTLAGQIVMEGFLDISLPPWIRRLITRLIAIVPAIIVTALYGEHGIGTLIILSQVILALQLSFAVIPLVLFTSSRAKMGEFANHPVTVVLAWTTAIVIAGLNGWLLVGMARQWLA